MNMKYLLVRPEINFWKVVIIFLRNIIRVTMNVIDIEIPSGLFSIMKNLSTAVILPAISFQCSAINSETGKVITMINVSTSHLFLNIEDMVRDASVRCRCI